MANKEQDKVVYFHPEQLKYLESIFPEQVHNPSASNEVIRHYNGQRSVVHFIRTKVR